MTMQKPRLANKVAIVAGAGSSAPGISNGRAAAITFAREGAKVAVLDVDGASAEETAQMIVAEGGEAVSMVVDVTDEAVAKDAVASVVERWKQVDVLQNNVGITGPIGNAINVDLAAWDRAMAINVKSIVIMSRQCLPHMIRGKHGSIVNVASVAGLFASQMPPDGSGISVLSYRATKGAVINLTRAMAADHGHAGVRVNCVAPGYIYTPLVRGISEAKREARRLAAPLGTEGTAWDVAMASLFLASDEARWITGVILPVDAGLTAAGLPPF